MLARVRRRFSRERFDSAASGYRNIRASVCSRGRSIFLVHGGELPRRGTHGLPADTLTDSPSNLLRVLSIGDVERLRRLRFVHARH